MSPRAALRLEMLGFHRVFDYVAGKEDWTAAILPTDGARSPGLRAGDVLSTDVPACQPHEPMALALERAASKRRCVVVTSDGIVLGLLRAKELKSSARGTAEQHMRAGPTTIRPNEWLAPLVERMQDAKVDRVLVTTPEGKLLGEVIRQEAERTLHAQHSGQTPPADRADHHHTAA